MSAFSELRSKLGSPQGPSVSWLNCWALDFELPEQLPELLVCLEYLEGAKLSLLYEDSLDIESAAQFLVLERVLDPSATLAIHAGEMSEWVPSRTDLQWLSAHSKASTRRGPGLSLSLDTQAEVERLDAWSAWLTCVASRLVRLELWGVTQPASELLKVLEHAARLERFELRQSVLEASMFASLIECLAKHRVRVIEMECTHIESGLDQWPVEESRGAFGSLERFDFDDCQLTGFEQPQSLIHWLDAIDSSRLEVLRLSGECQGASALEDLAKALPESLTTLDLENLCYPALSGHPYIEPIQIEHLHALARLPALSEFETPLRGVGEEIRASLDAARATRGLNVTFTPRSNPNWRRSITLSPQHALC